MVKLAASRKEVFVCGATLKEISDYIGLILDIFSILAISVGGIWVYFNYLRGRIYYPKLQLDVEVQVGGDDQFFDVFVVCSIKNVGISRVELDAEISAITISETLATTPMTGVTKAQVFELGSFDALAEKTWVESGESLTMSFIVNAARRDQIGFSAELVTVEAFSNRRGGLISWLFCPPQRYQWTRSGFCFVSIVPSSNIGVTIG